MALVHPDDSSRVRVQVLTQSADLLALRREWNALLQSSRSNNLFLTWEWVSTWWEHYGSPGTLEILTARDREGTLVGLAPLQRTRRRLFGVWGVDTLEFIGSGGDVTPEYLDVIASPAREADVINAFADLIREDHTVRGIDLRPLAEHSPHLARLAARLGEGRGSLRCVRGSVCPILKLPSTPDAFLAGKSRNYRKKIGEYQRKADRDLAARLRVTASAADLRGDMPALIDLHARRWRARSRAFRTPRYIEFHERLAQVLLERGWLRLFILESGSTPIAALYCFSYAGRYYFYQGGRDPRFERQRIGLVLMHRVIQEAIKEGASVFDFLSGDEHYKYRWADGAAQNVRMTYWKSAAARIGAGMWAPLTSVVGGRFGACPDNGGLLHVL